MTALTIRSVFADGQPVKKSEVIQVLEALAAGKNVRVPSAKGAWSPATEYTEGDLVERNGSLYIADVDNTNSAPELLTNWTLYLTGGSTADGSITDAKVATPVDISAGLRSGKVRYNLASDPGFKYRSVPDRLQEKISVKDFGALGDGVSRPLSTVTSVNGVNTAGWSLAQWQTIYPHAGSLTDQLDWCACQAAIDWAGNATRNPHGATVYFPRGRYWMSSTLKVTKDNVVLVGDGRLATTLYRELAGYGDTVLFNRGGDNILRGSGMRHMGCMQRGTPMTSGAHVHVWGVVDGLFSDLNLDSGYDGWRQQGCGRLDVAFVYVTNQFGTNFHRQFSIERGNGLTNNPVPTDCHYFGCEGIPLQNGYVCDVGFYIESADGLYFSNCHTNLCDISLLIEQGTTAKLGGLIFSNCWFDENGQRALLIQGSSAEGMLNYRFNNCIFRNNVEGVGTNVALAGACGQVTFSDCEFHASRGQGMSIGPSAHDIIIEGCIFSANNSDNLSVSTLSIEGDNTIVANNIFKGSQSNGAGISIVAGATGYVVAGNNLIGMTNLLPNARIADGGGAVAKVVANNLV